MNYTKSLTRPIIFVTVIINFILQFIAGFLFSVYCDLYRPDYVNSQPNSFSGLIDSFVDDWQTLIVFVTVTYLTYLFTGYLSAKLALRRNLAPYLHAVIAAFFLAIFSLIFTQILSFIIDGEFQSPSNEVQEASVGFKVLFFSQFILLPVIGVRLAVGKVRAKNIKQDSQKTESKVDILTPDKSLLEKSVSSSVPLKSGAVTKQQPNKLKKRRSKRK